MEIAQLTPTKWLAIWERGSELLRVLCYSEAEALAVLEGWKRQ